MPINFETVLPMPGSDRNWDHENKTLSRSKPGPGPKNKTLPEPEPRPGLKKLDPAHL